IIGLILQITVPLGEKVNHSEVATIVWPIIAVIILLTWIISIPITHLWIKNLAYLIEEERITINKGIISKIQQNIPYRAITDFMLHRSLFDRILGIGSIRIQTAGQSVTPTGYEGYLSGLIEWGKLLQELRSRVREYHTEPSAVAQPSVTKTDGSEDRLSLILEELKQIRELIERNIKV
ncbi:PH domain-containing protein, partial [Bacteroidota bacterium]